MIKGWSQCEGEVEGQVRHKCEGQAQGQTQTLNVYVQTRLDKEKKDDTYKTRQEPKDKIRSRDKIRYNLRTSDRQLQCVCEGIVVVKTPV